MKPGSGIGDWGLEERLNRCQPRFDRLPATVAAFVPGCSESRIPNPESQL